MPVCSATCSIHFVPFSTVAIERSSAPAHSLCGLREYIVKLPPTANVLQSGHAPPSIVGNCIMPSGKSRRHAALVGGGKGNAR